MVPGEDTIARLQAFESVGADVLYSPGLGWTASPTISPARFDRAQPTSC